MAVVTATPKGSVRVTLGTEFQVDYTCKCGGKLSLHQARPTAICGGCGTRYAFRVMVGRVPTRKP